jgi:hypothetical protein
VTGIACPRGQLKKLTLFLEYVSADVRASKFDECFVNVATTIEADTKTPKVVEPRASPPYHPAEFSQTATMFSSTPCDHRPDAAIAQALVMYVGVVAAIAVNDFRLAQWSATPPSNWGDGANQWQQLGDVVTVCAGQYHTDRHSVGVYEDVVLRT